MLCINYQGKDEVLVLAAVIINRVALLDVQPCLMEIVNTVEECVESNTRLNSTQDMEVDSASALESTLKVNLTYSSTVDKFVLD